MLVLGNLESEWPSSSKITDKQTSIEIDLFINAIYTYNADDLLSSTVFFLLLSALREDFLKCFHFKQIFI